MNVRIVTAPDMVFNYNDTVLLIHPTAHTKQELQNFLESFDRDIDIYIYDADDNSNAEWLINVVQNVNMICVEVDNCSSSTKDIISYVLGFNKTYWLTQGENIYYNTINKNRIYNIDTVLEKLKG